MGLLQLMEKACDKFSNWFFLYYSVHFFYKLFLKGKSLSTWLVARIR